MGEDRQEQIDRICKWMGWVNGGDYWKVNDSPLRLRLKDSFDPFTSPANCALVMEEVVKVKKWDILLKYVAIWGRWDCTVGKEAVMGHAYGTTETESKMLALLEAIENE